ncbi:MAG: NAD(P)-dependent oxidoreductase [bacterium]
MKVAVTGANGFLGSHVVERLLARGDEAVAVVRPGASMQWLDSTRATIRFATLTDEDSLSRAVSGAAAVIHLAGATRVRPLSRFHEINALGTRAVLDACARADASPRRLVLSSSLAAAGPSSSRGPLTESQPSLPVSAYGRSKRAAEQLALSDPRIEAVALRPTAIYGPRDVDMYQVLKLASWGVHVRLGPKNPSYNYLYVEDAADAFVRACHSRAAAGELFNIGDDTNYTPAESERIIARAVSTPHRVTLRLPNGLVRLAAAAAELATRGRARPPTLNRDKVQILTAGSWAVDIAKATELLGYEPSYTLERGLAKTVEWYRAEGWL